MSKVEDLKRRVEEQLPPEEAETVKIFIDTLSEEAAGGLLSLDEKTFTERVKTKNVRVVKDYKDIEKMRKAPLSPPEDYGEIEVQKAFPRIGELLFLIVSYGLDPETLEQEESTQSKEVHDFYNLFGELIKATKPTKQPKQHSLIVTQAARDMKKKLGTVVNNPKGKTRAERGRVIIDSERQDKKSHTIISTKISAVYTAEGKAEFQPIDFSIAGGIVDLINEGNLEFTPAAIWRATAQLKESQKVTPKQEEEVREAVERARATMLEFDITEEVHNYGLEDKLKEYYNEKTGRYTLPVNMLALEPKPINQNGKVKYGWKVLIDPETQKPALPGLYRHALLTARKEDKPQIASYKEEEISMNGKVSMTKAAVVIRDALLDNIHRINNGVGDSITFSQIFDLLRISDSGENAQEKDRIKKARQSARKTAAAILEQLKNNGVVKDYQIQKEAGIIRIITTIRGSLVISAQINSKSKAADSETPFSFNIKLRKKLSGNYGDTRFDKGEASITVVNGTELEIPGLPAGTGYLITPAGSGDYVLTKAAHDEGGILENAPSKATFIFTPKSELRRKRP